MKAEDSLVKGVGRLIGTAVEIGAALAGAVDKATAGNRDLPKAPPGETPAAAIIRHGVSAVSNVTRQVVDATQSARSAAAGAGVDPAAGASRMQDAPVGPDVQRGSTLRVPLSIENPGREPMIGLVPVIANWSRRDGAARAPGAVRFVPDRLDIEPRDFEKLTVFVDVESGAAPGTYRLDVNLGQGAEVAIDFTVTPAQPADQAATAESAERAGD